jgi:hypothetical protein
MKYEIEEVKIGKDLYNVEVELDVNIDGGVEIEKINSCYKHLTRIDALQRCEPLHGMQNAIEDFIKSEEDESTYIDIVSEHVALTQD